MTLRGRAGSTIRYPSQRKAGEANSIEREPIERLRASRSPTSIPQPVDPSSFPSPIAHEHPSSPLLFLRQGIGEGAELCHPLRDRRSCRPTSRKAGLADPQKLFEGEDQATAAGRGEFCAGDLPKKKISEMTLFRNPRRRKTLCRGQDTPPAPDASLDIRRDI